MKVFLESTVECTVDGVGLLEPGAPVEVDVARFELYHKVSPALANFPNHITVTYDTDAEIPAVESSEEAGEVN